MSKSQTKDTNTILTLEERRAFMKLPIVERRRRMADQAEKMMEHYRSAEESAQWEDWQGGDIVECE